MITIDDAVYAWDEDRGISNETILVTTAFDPQDVVRALDGPGGERLMSVGEDGVEYTDRQVWLDNARAGREVYTPNYKSDAEITPDGVEMYLDCKGAIEDEMAATLRRILVEVVSAAVPQAHIGVRIED